MSSRTDAEPQAGLTFEALSDRIRIAVQAIASTDPNPTDPFRGLYISDEAAVTLAEGELPSGLDARLAAISKRLELCAADATVLMLCVAPELDPRFGRLYAYLHDDVTRKLATPRLVARLAAGDGVSSDDVLMRFDRSAPLRRAGAIRILDQASQTPLADRPVKVADRLAADILGHRLDGPKAGANPRLVWPPDHHPGRSETLEEIRALIGHQTSLPVVVAGPDAERLLATAMGGPLLLVNIARVAEDEAIDDALIEAALSGAAICFDGLERLEPSSRPGVLAALEAFPGRPLFTARTRTAIVALEERTAVLVEAPLPSFGERQAAWSALSGSGETTDVAAKFRLSIGQITDAASVARLTALGRGDDIPKPADLDLGARQASSSRLGELATRLQPAFGWDDLVLPDRPREILQSISAYLRHRDQVLSEWGYQRTLARTQGLKVLFAGESGTGKTMASQVLARELGLELFRIDLATVVSKYIGETEKNLDRIFDAAEGSNAILFFDEADALFGKRSEVHDSHDRYANIEVAYLLQRMELYAGAVILATNFRQNIDDAFLRRLDFVIDFPFPETDDRRRIWRLVLPAEAPVADDVDLEFLAANFKLAGGNIRNASLAAAFLAAEEGGSIAMRHLIRGVALEYGKLGRLTLESDFDRFHEMIRPKTT
jgi:hypothetical protein